MRDDRLSAEGDGQESGNGQDRAAGSAGGGAGRVRVLGMPAASPVGRITGMRAAVMACRCGGASRGVVTSRRSAVGGGRGM